MSLSITDQNSFPQPKGINFSLNELIPIRIMSQSLCKIASFLQNVLHATQLVQYEDWWEHDGLHFRRGECSIHDLFSVIQTPRALMNSMQGDEYVYVGIAPPDNSWYLRFYINWDDTDEELEGYFDITLREDDAILFRKSVVAEFDFLLLEQTAADYYKSIIV
ncbi:MAG: hypothetical protein QM501_12525 [Gimesia sp.]